MKQRLDMPAILLLTFCCALWGLAQVSVKLAVTDIPPVMLGALRSIGAALLVAGSAAATGQKLYARDGTLGSGILAGLLFAAEFVVMYRAIELASASRTVLFVYSAPVFVALGAHWFVPGERLRAVQGAGLAACLLGIAAGFADAADFSDQHEIEGDALAMVSALLWAATTVVIKAGPLARAASTRTLNFQLVVSALALPLASLAGGEHWAIHPGRVALAALAYNTVVVAWLSYLGWFWLMRRYPAGRLSSFTFLTPLFGALFGKLILGERLSGRLGLALVLVSLGIYLVNRPGLPSAPPEGNAAPRT